MNECSLIELYKRIEFELLDDEIYSEANMLNAIEFALNIINKSECNDGVAKAVINAFTGYYLN